MLVSTQHRKLLLNLKDPDRVRGIIPTAKTLNVRGHEIVAVDHDITTAHVLRSIGLLAPSPVLYHYKWPGRYPPFSHQKETTAFATLNKRAYVLNDMGTGKTLSVLWAFDYLKSIGAVDWALVVSPLSTLERAWGDEVFRNFPNLTAGVVYGSADRRVKIANAEHDIYIINHDGLKNKNLLRLFATKAGTGLIIVDELAVFRNAATNRWKSLNKLINGHAKENLPRKDWVWGLTGTPIPIEPTDAWAQCRLVTPDVAPKYFTAFRDMTMRQITPYKWAPKSDALDTVYRMMQPAIRFSRDECLDLPPTTYATRQVELSPEQESMYKTMLTKLRAEYEGGQITAINAAAKRSKLLQIVCGVAYVKDGEDIIIPAEPRMAAVREVIEEAAAKVIVFVPLVGALNSVAEKLRERYTVSVVHGEVPKAQRDDIFHDFMQPNGARVLVANGGVMAHGLTLVSADTICWFAPAPSSDVEQQANARVTRPGQKLNTLIVRLQGSELERRMYARLDSCESTQDALLDLF